MPSWDSRHKAYIAEILEKCPDCNGDGFTAEHDSPDNHPNGECANCPIQVHCERCHANGYFANPQALVEYVDRQNKELVDEIIQSCRESARKSGTGSRPRFSKDTETRGEYYSRLQGFKSAMLVAERHSLEALRSKQDELKK